MRRKAAAGLLPEASVGTGSTHGTAANKRHGAGHDKSLECMRQSRKIDYSMAAPAVRRDSSYERIGQWRQHDLRIALWTTVLWNGDTVVSYKSSRWSLPVHVRVLADCPPEALATLRP